MSYYLLATSELSNGFENIKFIEYRAGEVDGEFPETVKAAVLIVSQFG